ncbi:MAG: phosphohydrolase [Desulfobulbaceae bacterium]|nr:phosphohydrolase [Desulfobulbaceae bacterium]
MQCPGQDSRYWDGEAVFESRCPKCGNVIEFFKDDSKRRCRQCDHEVLNPRIDFGCASYCPFAEQCLGSLPPEMLAQKQDLLIEKVALEMKRQHGEDFQKIGHASRAARFAEKLAKVEEANKAVVVLAAYLAEISETPESTPSRAKTILHELKANEALSDEVCTLIEHLAQRPEPSASSNSRVFHDAWNLASISSLMKDASTISQAKELASTLLTANGRQEAATLLT